MYRQPRGIEDALSVLADRRCTVLAGGTDLYPARVGMPPPPDVLDIGRIDALRGIVQRGEFLRIGAATTWSELLRAPLPPALQALAQAAREIGGIQIQNRATIGGNLCNASPAADGAVALLALDARVELASRGGRRELPLSQFVLGNRRTSLQPQELLTAVLVPLSARRSVSRFLKLGHRRYLVISIAMLAARLDFDSADRVVGAAIAVGACAPTARRLGGLEHALLGLSSGEVGAAAAHALDVDRDKMLAPLAPIDDVRGTVAYRRDAVATMLGRALAELAAPRAAGGAA